MTQEIKKDLEVWDRFLEKSNGISIWHSDWLLKTDLQIQSDALGGIGFVVYCQGQWCAQRWPESCVAQGITGDITFLECFPILAAVTMWGAIFQN